jgi:2-polyprenyl-6-methoxyphenol hydroxylase-like FAD-dependent oxidoreductase
MCSVRGQPRLTRATVGFGGLGAAIECHRHGHDVEIYEAFPELKALGDIISFGPNAGRIFHRWNNGEVARKMREYSIDLRAYGFNIHKYDTGEIVLNQRTPEGDPTAPNFNGHRGELHEIVYDYATKELGIPIHLNNKIRTYFEDEEQAGIVLETGEKVRPSSQPPALLSVTYPAQRLQVMWSLPPTGYDQKHASRF